MQLNLILRASAAAVYPSRLDARRVSAGSTQSKTFLGATRVSEIGPLVDPHNAIRQL